MTKTFNLDQIKKVLGSIDSIKAIEEGFVAYSEGKAVVPPIGEMLFENPPGEAHIKYGFIKNDDYYVIKIASGFYENYKINLPTNSGLMLLFSQKSGQLLCVLFDEGYLTAVRTAAAGAVVAKYLAPKNVHRIGVFGAGSQGRLQVEYLKPILDCKDVIVWGVNQEEVDAYKRYMESCGYNIQTTLDPNDIASSCNFIVTATPSKTPLLQSNQIKKGTHITAMGSDTSEKQELDSKILQMADIVVADSISQCQSRGEIYQALKAGVLKEGKPVELGTVIIRKDLQRTSDEQITVADLTGVAVQDVQISKAVYEALIS
ncbi:MAG: ornithine cyclodeaminase family protein [Candidatus Aminicenantales bacterium]